VNNKLERMRKEAVVTYLKVLCRRLPGGTEVNHENVSQCSRLRGLNLNLGPRIQSRSVKHSTATFGQKY
jgi:hypothetical protein